MTDQVAGVEESSDERQQLFMTTHMPFDPYLNEEAVAEVREHWKGPFHFGHPMVSS